MSFSVVLDVAIGLALVYLVLSVLVSRINEYVATRLNWRFTGLEKAIRGLVEGTPATPDKRLAIIGRGLLDLVFRRRGDPYALPAGKGAGFPENNLPLTAGKVLAHPVVRAISAATDKPPSYLPSRAFATAVLDLLAPADPSGNPPHQSPLERAREAVTTLPPAVKDPLLRMIHDAEGDLSRFRRQLERWYDDAMGRVAGWYKRRVQLWMLIYGTVLILAFNIDTINIAQSLYQAPSTRAAVSSAAQNVGGSLKDVDASVRDLSALNLPVGWAKPSIQQDGKKVTNPDPRSSPRTPAGWLIKLLGLVLTLIALSFGAPFWFDALGRLARLRNAGDKPTPTPPAMPAGSVDLSVAMPPAGPGKAADEGAGT